MYRRLILAILCLPLLASSGAHATGAIRGGIEADPVNGVVVELLDESGRVMRSTAVDDLRGPSVGFFGFASVPAGSYYLRFNGIFIVGATAGPVQVQDNATQQVGYTLTPTTAAFIADLFAVAVVNPNGFPDYVRARKSWIDGDPALFECIEMTAQMLLDGSMQTDRNEKYKERITAIGSGVSMPPHIISETLSNREQQNLELQAMGRWLRQLAASIPSILNGDSSRYYNSEMYALCSLGRQVIEQTIGSPLVQAQWQHYGITFEGYLTFLLYMEFELTYLYSEPACAIVASRRSSASP